MKKILSVILSAVLLLSVFSVASFAEDVPVDEPIDTPVDVTVIDAISIDFIRPEVGEKADIENILSTDGCTVKEAMWFEKASDDFIDVDATFSEGTYYIQVVFEANEEYAFAEEVSVAINGEEAISVELNEDGTLTAIGEFECSKEPESPSIFKKLFTLLRSAALAFVKLIGTLLGLK